MSETSLPECRLKQLAECALLCVRIWLSLEDDSHWRRCECVHDVASKFIGTWKRSGCASTCHNCRSIMVLGHVEARSVPFTCFASPKNLKNGVIFKYYFARVATDRYVVCKT